MGEAGAGQSAGAARWWAGTREFLGVLRPAWWVPPLYLVLLAAMLLPDQSRDLAVSLQERGILEGSFYTSIGVASLGLTVWLALRVLFLRICPYTPPYKPWHRHVWAWTPRIAGAAAPALFALCFLILGALELALVQAGLAAALFLVFLIRRRVFDFVVFLRPELRGSLAPREARKPGLILLLFFLYSVPFFVISFFTFLTEPIDGPRRYGAIAMATVGLAFFVNVIPFFYAVVADGVHRWLRGLVRDPSATFPLGLVAVLLFIAVNHGGQPRHYAPAMPSEAPAPVLTSLDAYAQDWLRARREAIAAASPENPYEVYVVAAEGGGLRAAVWTGVVLARRQDLDPSFADRTFVVSGVSGGALGAASFAAAVRARHAVPDDAPAPSAEAAACKPAPASAASADVAGSAPGPIEALVTAHLAQDHLAPVVAGVAPDLVASLAPRSATLIERYALTYPAFDRGHYLERSWAEAWPDALCATEPFRSRLDKETMAGLAALFALDGDFLDLWRPLRGGEGAAGGGPLALGASHMPPALILPATSVRSGDPWMTAPLAVRDVAKPALAQAYAQAQGRAERGASDLARQEREERNLLVAIGEGGCVLSTPAAAHLSARFLYISPAARLDDGRPCDRPGDDAPAAGSGGYDRFVDGGYFEGSGAHRALEAAQALMDGLETLDRRDASGGWSGKVRIVPIIIRYEEDASGLAPPAFLPDLTAPLAAVLRTRSARGAQAVEDLARLDRTGQAAPEICELPARDLARSDKKAQDTPVPLGWVLSPVMRDRIKDAAAAVVTGKEGRAQCRPPS